MSGPSKKSSPSSEDSQNLLVRVQRLRLEAEDFKKTVEDELRTVLAQIEELGGSGQKAGAWKTNGLRSCLAIGS